MVHDFFAALFLIALRIRAAKVFSASSQEFAPIGRCPAPARFIGIKHAIGSLIWLIVAGPLAQYPSSTGGVMGLPSNFGLFRIPCRRRPEARKPIRS